MFNTKKRIFYITFIILNFINLRQALSYDISDTPAKIVLKYFGRHSYLGVSSGLKYGFHNFVFVSTTAKLLIKEKKEIFIHNTLGPSLSNQKEEFRLFRFLWPNEVYFKMDPKLELKSWSEGAVEDMKTNLNNDEKPDNRAIKATSFIIPIKFTYMYEFDSKKFRISIDPTINFVRASSLLIKTIPKPNSNRKSEKLATIKLKDAWSTNLEIPLTLYYRIIHTKVIDTFLFLSGGLFFSSWKLGSEQAFFYRFWNLGLTFEYPDQINFKPFLNFIYQTSSFLETRLSANKRNTPIILNNKSIGIEFGVRCKILPDKSKCGIPNCNIKYDHVHGHTNLRGRSYFNS